MADEVADAAEQVDDAVADMEEQVSQDEVCDAINKYTLSQHSLTCCFCCDN